MRPGPKPQPWPNLSYAAILYADALEAGTPLDIRRTKARLRAAALRYQRAPKRKGRPCTTK